MSINGKNFHKIGVFLDGNLNFAIGVSTWGLANYLPLCKNCKNPIILSNLISEIIQFQIYEDNHNAKVSQLDQQLEVPKFQDSLICYKKMNEKVVRTFFIDVQNFSISYLFLPNSIKIEN